MDNGSSSPSASEADPERKRAWRPRVAARRQSPGLGVIAAAALAGAIWLLVSAAQAQSTPAPEATDGGRAVGASLLVVLALILVNGIFAMSEAAVLSVRRSRVAQLVEEGNRRAAALARLLAEPTQMLSTLQVGVTLVGFFSAGAAAEIAVRPLAALLRGRFPDTILSANAHGISFTLVLLTVSLLSLVVGEITPKSIAVRHADVIALWSAYPIDALRRFLLPVVGMVTVLSNLLVKPFGGTASFHASAMSEDELKIMVEHSEEYGVIETEEKEMIHSIFDLGETRVSKVMTPRLDITSVEADASVEALVEAVTASGHSRLPIYDDDLDNIVGIVHAKDVLTSVVSKGGKATIRSLMRAPYFIPETKRVSDLLGEFRRYHRQVAIVRNEYGTVTGIVTIEDLVEEIVGEIQDEYDVEEPTFKQMEDGTASVDGRISITDFNERMGTQLPEEESDTLGGLVFTLLGHQPVQGEVASWDGIEFRVEATDGRRIQRLLVSAKAHSADTGAVEGGGASAEPRRPNGAAE